MRPCRRPASTGSRAASAYASALRRAALRAAPAPRHAGADGHEPAASCQRRVLSAAPGVPWPRRWRLFGAGLRPDAAWPAGARAAPRASAPANRVTLARLALIALLAGVVGEQLDPTGALAWGVVGLATRRRAARRGRRAAGARRRHWPANSARASTWKPMRCWCWCCARWSLQFDKAGAWVLAAGLMRYLFVAAAATWPWMARPLPPSLRRKAVCVALIVCLIACLAPVVDAAAGAAAGRRRAGGAGPFLRGRPALAGPRHRHQPQETVPP